MKPKQNKKENVIYVRDDGKTWKNIVIGLTFFILVLIVITAWRDLALEHKDVYQTCVKGCSAKHFNGLQLGPDASVIALAWVNEFDRTDCITNCNIMYLKLK